LTGRNRPVTIEIPITEKQMTQEAKQLLTFEEKCEYLANKVRAVVAAEGSDPVVDEATGEPVKGMGLLKDRLTRMKRVQQAYEILKPVIDGLNAEYDQLRKKVVPDLAAEQDVRTITIEGIGRLQLTGDYYASIPAEQQDAAFEWFRANGYSDLIKETVHSATLKAWSKEMLEQGRVGPEEKAVSDEANTAAASLGIEQDKGPAKLPEGVFKIEPYTRASIVKVKGAKSK